MTLQHWGLVLEIVGFVFIAFFVGIILTFKSELGVKPLLDRQKERIVKLSNKRSVLRPLKEHNRVTVALAIAGTVMYFLGLLLQAISTW